MTVIEKIELIKVKLEILKLKADDYNWQCHTPAPVKNELEQILAEVTAALTSEAKP